MSSTTMKKVESQDLLDKYAGVTDPEEIREYITNRLLEESTDDDARVRLGALKMLGDLEVVGAFSEKKRVLITNESNAKLELLLEKKLRKLMGRTIEGEVMK